MKLFIFIPIIWVTILFSSAAKGITSQYVYCENLDTEEWEWLQDQNDNFVKVKGIWQYILDYPEHGVAIKAFKVPQLTLKELNKKCSDEFGKEWVSHPGESWLDDWYLFYYVSDQKNFLSKGSYDYHFYK
tara:strand:+ start:4852 stop:5241 length:390 start_codon:yes stop_codon:yes gene_type:complete